MKSVRSTLFVLGAAANIELDNNTAMPVGSDLAIRIQDQLSSELNSGSQFSDGPVSNAIASSGGLTSAHMQALRRIEQGITYRESIDQFIHEWADQECLPEAGKMAIAYQILEAESRTGFRKALRDEQASTAAMRGIRESWLGQIFRFANPEARRRDVSECFRGISFVTFNYDRCLEAAIYLFLRYGQNLNEAQTQDAMENIPIIHAYGDLGPMKFYGGSGHDANPVTAGDISRAAGRIRTFTEECDSVHQRKLQSLVEEADCVVFLGFGFHKKNMDLIEPTGYWGKQIFGTVYGMREQEIARVQDYFLDHGAEYKLQQLSCSALLDKHRESIFE